MGKKEEGAGAGGAEAGGAPNRLLTVRQVARRLSCSVSLVRRRSAPGGTFPRPIKLPVPGSGQAQTYRYFEHELESFIDRLKAERDGGPAAPAPR